MTLPRTCGPFHLFPRAWPFLLIALFVAEASGQFTTVINVPPDVAPYTIVSDTQVNVFDGGILTSGQAGESDGSSTNVEVNFFGGWVDRGFRANSGSAVTISGGTVGTRFNASSGSTVTLSGGTVGDDFLARSGSAVTISGGEFRLDGVLVSGLETEGNTIPLEVSADALLSGTLADGTPFAFSAADSSLWFSGDFIASGVLTLEAAALPPVGPALITASSDEVPLGIRQGQTLRVDDVGVVPDNFNAGLGSTVNVEAGGSVGRNLEAVGAEVTISGGSVGDRFGAFSGSTVTISGGSVGDRFVTGLGSRVTISGGSVGKLFRAGSGSDVTISGGSVEWLARALSGSAVTISGGSLGYFFIANSGSTVNVTGGNVSNNLTALSGSVVTISGGNVGDDFTAHPGSVVTISGGNVGDGFTASGMVTISGGTVGDDFRGSTVTLSGGEFRLDGVLVGGLESEGSAISLDVPHGALLSGTLADGTPFAFSSRDGDSFASGALTLAAAALPPVGPAQIIASTDAVPLGIRQGQTLRVDDGGVVPDNFNAGLGTTVYVEAGGSVGNNFEAVDADVTISGGSVGDAFDAFRGSTVTISGGSLGDDFDAFGGSAVTISGGSVGDDFDAFTGSTVTISGGSVGDDFEANWASTVTISGGTVGDRFDAINGSVVTISGGSVGREFNTRWGSIVTISGGSVDDGFDALSGSMVTISGGTVGDRFRAFSGSEIDIFGTEFFLDGVRLEELVNPGDSLVLETRAGRRLTGTLLDGNTFNFNLTASSTMTDDFFHPNATLRLTLAVPEPSAWVLACLACLTCLAYFRTRVGSEVGAGQRRDLAWGVQFVGLSVS